jgi:molybdopterin molybdotransferase
MLSTADADQLLASLHHVGRIETVSLAQAAGRCLAYRLLADRDGPPYHRVAMDGYAVDATENLSTWTVRGLQLAGKPPQDRSGQATAIEVSTGAVLPGGCDAVVRYEDTQRTGDTVHLKQGMLLPLPGSHVHHQGSDYHKGDQLLASGLILRSPHLHSLASAGSDPVSVVSRPRWALAATGDELVEVRDEPLGWQIRRSNAAAIIGEATAWGLGPDTETVLPDHRAGLKAGLEKVLPGLDVLVLTGGVSAGRLDLVPEVLTEMGAQTLFHKIDQRPGKPLWCGQLGSTVLFGLPGNPVSSLFAFRRYVLPWLLACEGRPLAEVRVKVKGLKPHTGHQTVFLPWSREHGVLHWKGSGDFLALADSDGFIEVDTDPRSLSEPRVHQWGGNW